MKKKKEKQYAEHHCSVIEGNLVKDELAQCDEKFENPEEVGSCYAKVNENSKKRERACKFS